MPLLSLAPDRVVHYETIAAADASRPRLVFLHEGLGCAAMWGDFPQRLCAASGCPGLVYDRLGYGRSSPLRQPRRANYLHEYALEELPAILDRLLPARDYVIVGHSDGGSIGLIHAATRPPRLRGLLTEAAHVFVEPETLAGIRAAGTAHAGGKLRGLARFHGEHADAVFRAWHDTWLADGFRDWNIEALLPAIDVPVLVVQGADDQYATLAQVEAIATRVARSRRAVLADCAHVPHREQPEAVLDLMRSFLRDAVGCGDD